MKNIILLIACIILFQSCEITKSAFKNKKNKSVETDLTTLDKTKTFDFSTVDSENDVFKFEPKDASKYMSITTKKGDTINVKNASITRSKNKTRISKNITQANDVKNDYNSVSKTDEVIKTKDKTEKLSDRFVLYIVLGFVLIVIVCFIAALFLISKKIDKLTPLFR